MPNNLSPKASLVQKIALLSAAIVVLHLTLGLILGYPLWVNLFLLLCLCNMGFVLLLLKRSKETGAKILFLSSAYLIISALTPIFGYALNTHLFLIPGVGMALIFFDNEIGNHRWWFVLAGFPVWLVIEFWGKSLPVAANISNQFITPLAQLNIALTLVTSCAMFYFFTTRLQTQYKLVEKEKQSAENSVKRLTQFNHLLAHDLKSPLANIKSMVSLITNEHHELPQEEIEELLLLLKTQSESSIRLVNGITDYFKDTKKLPPEWENTNALIKEVLGLLMVKPNFTIKIDALPHVHLSYIAIRQLMQNLITNALKYNDKAQGELHIFYSEDKEYGKLCFKDNGVGMTEVQQKKAFQLFTLFHKMAESQSSGMGLAIANELVQNNDGFIEIHSVLNQGSQFNLCFPLERFRII